MACMCGDTACPSCGPAQGCNPAEELVAEWMAEVVLKDVPAIQGTDDLAWEVTRSLGRQSQWVAEALESAARQWAQSRKQAAWKLICIGPFCWGKGATREEAMKNAAVNCSGGMRVLKRHYLIYECHPLTTVDGMGAFCYPSGPESQQDLNKPRLVEEVKPKERKKKPRKS